MGMFDELKCDYPMPKGYEFLQKEGFQTKEFDNLLDEYLITKDGELVRTIKEWSMVPEEKRPFYGTSEWDDYPIYKMFGSIKTEKTGKEKIEYHGYVHFHTIVNNVFYDLKAKFTDGKVVDLVIERENKLGEKK